MIAFENSSASTLPPLRIKRTDPRGGVDPVDWIESIPFAETRSHVQRVLENTQVHRHRLAGAPADVQLSSDIRRDRPK